MSIGKRCGGFTGGASSKAVAEQVENYYLDKGMQGDTGGGTEESKIVYCYEIGPLTIDGAS